MPPQRRNQQPPQDRPVLRRSGRLNSSRNQPPPPTNPGSEPAGDFVQSFVFLEATHQPPGADNLSDVVMFAHPGNDNVFEATGSVSFVFHQGSAPYMHRFLPSPHHFHGDAPHPGQDELDFPDGLAEGYQDHFDDGDDDHSESSSDRDGEFSENESNRHEEMAANLFDVFRTALSGRTMSGPAYVPPPNYQADQPSTSRYNLRPRTNPPPFEPTRRRSQSRQAHEGPHSFGRFADGIAQLLMEALMNAGRLQGIGQSQQGQPPASMEAQDKLKKIDVPSGKILQTCPKCLICQEDYSFTDMNRPESVLHSISSSTASSSSTQDFLLEMPCKHLFHCECLSSWLVQSNMCPTCRYEIMTDNSDYNVLVSERMSSRDEHIKREEELEKQANVLKRQLTHPGQVSPPSKKRNVAAEPSTANNQEIPVVKRNTRNASSKR